MGWVLSPGSDDVAISSPIFCSLGASLLNFGGCWEWVWTLQPELLGWDKDGAACLPALACAVLGAGADRGAGVFFLTMV